MIIEIVNYKTQHGETFQCYLFGTRITLSPMDLLNGKDEDTVRELLPSEVNAAVKKIYCCSTIGRLHVVVEMTATELVSIVVKYWREKKNLSQREFAKLCGFRSATSIARIENGIHSPTLVHLEKVLDVLGLSMVVISKTKG